MHIIPAYDAKQRELHDGQNQVAVSEEQQARPHEAHDTVRKEAHGPPRPPLGTQREWRLHVIRERVNVRRELDNGRDGLVVRVRVPHDTAVQLTLDRLVSC